MTNEEKVLQLFDQYNKISPAFICRKLKVTMEVAKELCQKAYVEMGRKAFLRRAGLIDD